ncbi:MAG: rod shape-determining protein RodA [Balneolaceae bacterium]|nr:MAG: rod shape-determining protein RodA [Balneolaceae bacterium]
MSWYRQIDWVTFLTWLAISAIGLVAVYSATQGPLHQGTHIQGNFIKQFMYVCLGIVVLIILHFTAPRTFQQVSYLAYGLAILLGIITIFFGVEVSGEKNWLPVFGFRLQTSEFLKVATILAVANFLTSRRENQAGTFRTALTATLMLFLPVIIILIQSDTGTALVFLALIPIMLLWSGVPYGLCLLMVSPVIIGYLTVIDYVWGLLAAVIITIIFFFLEKKPLFTFGTFLASIIIVIGVQVGLHDVLQPHQRSRIEAFANPALDPRGAGWNVMQAKTAIGSGGIYGKGFMQGTQTQLRFLPEQSTDFIFCVIGEEGGLISTSLVLMLLALLLMRLLGQAAAHKHPFAQLFIVGACSIYLIHVVINLGSALGLMPVIGLPLPFLSYGGSSFLAKTIMLGICMNFYYHQRDFSIYS